MNRTENRRDFLRFNDAVQRARLEYARTLADLEQTVTERIDCGTARGYRRHYREGEPICDPCRTAYNAATRERYRKNKES